MRARLAGALAIGASLLIGGVARGEEGTGARETKELSGKFVGSDASTLYLEHMGAVVPLEIARGTRFSGVGSVDDLAGGQELWASFKVVAQTRNVADSVSLGAAPWSEAVPRSVGDDPYDRSADFGG